MKVPDAGPHLFLCHSSKDKRFVRRLAHDLRRLRVEAWFDDWELAPGDSLLGTIGMALEKSAYVCIVLSSHSAESRWCRRELDQALSREIRTGQKVVIPIRYRHAQIPAFLEDKAYIDFSRNYWRSLARLVGFISEADQSSLMRQLEIAPLRTLQDVEEVLRLAGWDGVTMIPRKDFENLRLLLQAWEIHMRGDRLRLEDEDGIVRTVVP